MTYYDVMDMPLSAFEIWKHLISQATDRTTVVEPCTLGEVWAQLAPDMRSERLEEHDGFYHLRGRAELVARRIQAEKISVEKLRRLRRLSRFLAWIPYLRMLGATGSVAMKNSARESDWDLFVVLRSGKIWSGRTLLTGLLHAVRKRRHGKKIRDRACLNYFVTEDNLEIGTQDLFSSHEYRFFIPLLNFFLFRHFEAKNSWIRGYRPNFIPTTLPSLWTLDNLSWQVKLQQRLERLLDIFDLERWLAGWQRNKILHNPKTALAGSLIEANERALIFLPRPRGPRVFQKFKERLGA